MTVRVLVADDHPIVRSGLVGLLASDPGLEVVAEAENGAQAVERFEAQPVDVVLMDLRMPVLDGVAATTQLLAADPKARVLVLTTYESDDQILAAIEAGASGYLLKAAPRRRSSQASRRSPTAARPCHHPWLRCWFHKCVPGPNPASKPPIRRP